MAIQHFLQGGYRGKLGETVGAEWRGIPTLRTYAIPKQPKTPAQILHYDNFRRMIRIANSLHKTWLPLVFEQMDGKTLSNQFMTLNKGIYATDGMSYYPQFPYDHSAIQIYGHNNTYGGDFYSTTRDIMDTAPEGTVENLLTLMYCPEKAECAYQITHALPSQVSIRFPSVWTGYKVITISQVITTAGIYEPYYYDWGTWNH